MTTPAAPRPVDVHALPTMLTALRLPSFQHHWQALAERADTEGWPASRFLAALAELELAERDAGASIVTSSSPSCPEAKPLAPSTSRPCPG